VVLKNCLIKPLYAETTALPPDVVVLNKAELGSEPLWQKEPVICKDSTIKLVAEVVSTKWQDDYVRKVEEYALVKRAKYWIVAFRGLGFAINRPSQATYFHRLPVG
jgi:Uma2 family endonuclease